MLLNRLAALLRAIVGAPDYDRYVAHRLASHPGECVLTRDEFMQERLQARYSKPGARCC